VFVERRAYPFLSRLRRPEGLSPRIHYTEKIRIGAPRKVVFEGSLIIALLVVITAFKFFPDVERNTMPIDLTQEFVEFEEIDNTRQENRPPPPPRPPIPIEAPGSDEMLEDVDLSSELDFTADVAPPAPTTDDLDDEDQYFVAVEEDPVPIGGLESILSRLQYPEIAKRAGVQGRVYVLAYINEKGEVVRAEVVKGIGAGCDEEAVKAVLGSKFKPGMQRGKPVKVKISIPIRFQLSS
jgi:protein TonB